MFYLDKKSTRKEKDTALGEKDKTTFPLDRWKLALIVCGIATCLFSILFCLAVSCDARKNSENDLNDAVSYLNAATPFFSIALFAFSCDASTKVLPPKSVRIPAKKMMVFSGLIISIFMGYSMHTQIEAYEDAYREPDERFIHDSFAIGFLPDYNVTFKLAISACNAESMSVASMNSLIETIDAENNQYISTKITPIDWVVLSKKSEGKDFRNLLNESDCNEYNSVIYVAHYIITFSFLSYEHSSRHDEDAYTSSFAESKISTRASFTQVDDRDDIYYISRWRMENMFEKPNQQYAWPYCHQKSGDMSKFKCEAEETTFIIDYGVNYVDLYGSEKFKFHMLPPTRYQADEKNVFDRVGTIINLKFDFFFNEPGYVHTIRTVQVMSSDLNDLCVSLISWTSGFLSVFSFLFPNVLKNRRFVGYSD